MILIYTDTIDSALHIAVEIGSVALINQSIKKSQIEDNIEKVKSDGITKGYFEVNIQGLSALSYHTAIIIWNKDTLFTPYNIADYPVNPYNNTSCTFENFLHEEIEYRQVKGKEDKNSKFLNFFKNKAYDKIICVANSPTSILSFYYLYYFAKKANSQVGLDFGDISNAYQLHFLDMTHDTIIHTLNTLQNEKDINDIICSEIEKRELSIRAAYVLNYIIKKITKHPSFITVPIYLALKELVLTEDKLNTTAKTETYTIRASVSTTSDEQFNMEISSQDTSLEYEEAENIIASLPNKGTIIDIEKTAAAKKTKNYIAKENIVKCCKETYNLSEEEINHILHTLFDHGYITYPDTNGMKVMESNFESLYQTLSNIRFDETPQIISKLNTKYIPNEYRTRDIEEAGIYLSGKVMDLPSSTENEKKVYTLIALQCAELLKLTNKEEKTKILAKFGEYTFVAQETYSASYDDFKKIKNSVLPLNIDTSNTVYANFSLIRAKKEELPCYTYERLLEFITKELSKTLYNISDSQAKGMIMILQKLNYITLEENRITTKKLGRYVCNFLQTISNNKSYTQINDIIELLSIADKQQLKKSSIICPFCNSSTIETSEGFVCLNCNFRVEKKQYGRLLKTKEIQFLLEHKCTPFMSGLTFEEEETAGRLLLLNNRKIIFTRESLYSCPLCNHKMNIKKNFTGYICSNCKFTLKFLYHGNRLSKEELDSLLKNHCNTQVRLFTIEGEKCFGNFVIENNKIIFKKLPL